MIYYNNGKLKVKGSLVTILADIATVLHALTLQRSKDTEKPYKEALKWLTKNIITPMLELHNSESEGKDAGKTESKAQAETNADVIKRMTNEQLAEFISRVEIGDFTALDYGVTFCHLCEKDGNSLNLDCDGCLRHWLDSPATDCFGLLTDSLRTLYETGGKDVENAD